MGGLANRKPRRESRKLPAGQPFRDQFGVEDAILVPGASADYPIAVFHLTGINVVRLCAAGNFSSLEPTLRTVSLD